MLPQLDGLKMHMPLTTKMQLRKHMFSCYKLPVGVDSNCTLPKLVRLKMLVKLSMKILLRSQ